MFLLKEELNLNELSNAVSLWIVWGEGRSKSKRGKNKQRENGAWFLLFAARESERTACSFLEKRVARIPALKRPCGTRGSARISANVEFSKSLFHRSNSLHLFVSRYEFRARRERERPVRIKPKIPFQHPGNEAGELVVETEFILRKWSPWNVTRHFSTAGRFGRFILSAESL